MRIIDMRPEITPFKAGTSRKVGKWSFTDELRPIGGHVRSIYHYSTKMGEYVGFERGFDHDRGEVTLEWEFYPVSIGHGSVSDQGGMNQLMSVQYRHGIGVTHDYGYHYLRDIAGGGPRILNKHTGEEVS